MQQNVGRVYIKIWQRSSFYTLLMMVLVICVHYKLIQCGSVDFSPLCLNLTNVQENEVCALTNKTIPLSLCVYLRKCYTAWIKHLILSVWQVTQGFELYAVFGPLITKTSAIHAVNKLLRWIKREEDRLFILNSVTFWCVPYLTLWGFLLFGFDTSVAEVFSLRPRRHLSQLLSVRVLPKENHCCHWR